MGSTCTCCVNMGCQIHIKILQINEVRPDHDGEETIHLECEFGQFHRNKFEKQETEVQETVTKCWQQFFCPKIFISTCH